MQVELDKVPEPSNKITIPMIVAPLLLSHSTASVRISGKISKASSKITLVPSRDSELTSP